MRKDNLDWGKRDPCPPGGQQRPCVPGDARKCVLGSLCQAGGCRYKWLVGQRLGALTKEGEVGPTGPLFIFEGSVSQSLHPCMKSQAIAGRMSSRLT